MSLTEIQDRVERLEARVEHRIYILEAALQRIVQWADAYPLHIFPEMDHDYAARAHQVLTEHGMTLDRIAANCMRHVIEGVSKIAKEALDDS